MSRRVFPLSLVAFYTVITQFPAFQDVSIFAQVFGAAGFDTCTMDLRALLQAGQVNRSSITDICVYCPRLDLPPRAKDLVISPAAA